MDMLQVKNGQVVDAQDRPVRLRGTCVGGWMNMENFITGYPGTEHGLRLAMTEVLGSEKAQFFFERLLDYFLAEEDIAFIRSCGATVVRLPLNYRHFESDATPFQYRVAGLARLDQVVRWCGQHGLYVILDLHAVPGCQNPDWHSDNSSGHGFFWQHPHFQERFVALWRELAAHYRGNPAVAGYNVMNEPVTGWARGRSIAPYQTDWAMLNRIYRDVVRTIRQIDPQHIIFLEGDWWSTRFAGLDAPFDGNLVYSNHHYVKATLGPGPYPGMVRGQHWDRAYQAELFAAQEGVHYARQHNVPLWVGEFGCVCNGPVEERGDRLRALDDEIDVFEEFAAHWTTWTYKDIGVMGWVQLDPESDYMRVIRPVLDAKAQLSTDTWSSWVPYPPAREVVRDLARIVAQAMGDVDPQAVEEVLSAAALGEAAARMLQPAYARRFRGMSEADLDRVLQSFALKNCRIQRDIIDIVEKHAGRPA